MQDTSTLITNDIDVASALMADGMLVFRPTHNHSGQPLDFVVARCSERAAAVWGQSLTGQLLSQLIPPDEAHFLLRQCSLVADTGRAVRFEMLLPGHEDARAHTVLVAKQGAYVVMSWRGDRDPDNYVDQTLLEQTAMLQQGKDQSASMVDLLEAVRGADGRIVDFVYRMVNQARLRAMRLAEAQVIGKRLLRLFPGVVETGVFARLVAVVETGVLQQQETCHSAGGHEVWTDASYSRYNDGVITIGFDTTAAKVAEKQKQQQATLLESIQNTSQMGIVAYEAVRDEAGAIIDVKPVFRNKASIAMTRAAAEAATQKTLTELLPSVKKTALLERYARVIDTGQAEQFEHYHNNNGYEAWYEISAQPWEDGVLVNVLEVSKLRHYEFERIQQAALLQQVIDSTQAGLMLARPVRSEQGLITDFRYVLTNEYNARTTGMSVEKLTGGLMRELFPGWHTSTMFGQFVEVMETGVPLRLTFPFDSHGIKGWFEGSFSRVDGCILYTYIDVTALKEAELAQQQYADLLERVMNTAPTGIVVHESVRDEQGTLVDFRMVQLNQAAADTLGSTIAQVQQQLLSRSFPGLLAVPLFEQCKQVVKTGEPVRTDVQWGDQWYDISIARFGDGFVAAAQTITATRQYRHDLEVANYELNRSNESLKSFAYVASHDLQEPLRKITSFANILDTHYAGQFTPEVADIIRRMNGASQRMRQLIEDILTYSQVDARHEPFKSVDLVNLIGAIQEDGLWAAIYQNKAQVEIGALPTLKADPLQMRQLFQNLLSNAIKFCPKGTIPHIRVNSRTVLQADVPPTLLQPGQDTPGAFYEITVSDNGIGFDEKYADRIFQIFQRLHGRTAFVGSGIGLAICQKIVARHNGAITATSQVGKGSTFIVYLPV